MTTEQTAAMDLTTNELQQIVPEMNKDVISDWVNRGIIAPASGGGVQNHRMSWDWKTVFALRHAFNIGKVVNGAGMLHPGVRTNEFRKLAANFLATVDTAEWDNAEEGHTLLVFTGVDGKLFDFIAPPEGAEIPDHLNVAKTWSAVIEEAEALVKAREVSE